LKIDVELKGLIYLILSDIKLILNYNTVILIFKIINK